MDRIQQPDAEIDKDLLLRVWMEMRDMGPAGHRYDGPDSYMIHSHNNFALNLHAGLFRALDRGAISKSVLHGRGWHITMQIYNPHNGYPTVVMDHPELWIDLRSNSFNHDWTMLLLSN